MYMDSFQLGKLQKAVVIRAVNLILIL